MKKFRIVKEYLGTKGDMIDTKEFTKYFPEKETARKYYEWENKKSKNVRYKVKGEVK